MRLPILFSKQIYNYLTHVLNFYNTLVTINPSYMCKNEELGFKIHSKK